MTTCSRKRSTSTLAFVLLASACSIDGLPETSSSGSTGGIGGSGGNGGSSAGASSGGKGGSGSGGRASGGAGGASATGGRSGASGGTGSTSTGGNAGHDGGLDAGSGGVNGTGGAGSGGSPTGGAPSSGGADASATGGVTSSGGAGGAATGGVTSSGGAGGAATGGAPSSGGAGGTDGGALQVVWRQSIQSGGTGQMNPLRITASGTRAYLQTWYGEAVRFARNPTTGILSSPTVQGVLWNTTWIEFDSAGTYAYVATGNRWEGNRLLTAFSVDSATGGLAEIDSEYLGSLGPESTAPNRATSVVLHPNGKYLYSVFGNWQTSAAGAQVARMLVGSDGKLTPATPPFNDLTTQDNAATLVLASDGSALYAAQHTANKIVRFAVSSTNGSLTETGSFTGGFGPRLGATCKKAGVEHVYAGNYSPDDANLSQGTCGVWDVSFAGGTLQGSVQHGPSQHPELAGAWSVAADPACEYLFAAGAFSSGGTATSSGITFFRILADGSLAYLGNTPSKPNMTQNGMLSVSGDGRFLYSVEDYNVNWVHVFEIVR